MLHRRLADPPRLELVVKDHMDKTRTRPLVREDENEKYM